MPARDRGVPACRDRAAQLFPSPGPGAGGLAGRAGAGRGWAGGRGLSADASALARRRLVHALPFTGAALAAAAGHLVDRGPGAACRLAPGDAAVLVALFDLARLAPLLARVFRFVASRHRVSSIGCYSCRTNALEAAPVPPLQNRPGRVEVDRSGWPA